MNQSGFPSPLAAIRWRAPEARAVLEGAHAVARRVAAPVQTFASYGPVRTIGKMTLWSMAYCLHEQARGRLINGEVPTPGDTLMSGVAIGITFGLAVFVVERVIARLAFPVLEDRHIARANCEGRLAKAQRLAGNDQIYLPFPHTWTNRYKEFMMKVGALLAVVAHPLLVIAPLLVFFDPLNLKSSANLFALMAQMPSNTRNDFVRRGALQTLLALGHLVPPFAFLSLILF